jgi:hypothetical protein
MEVLTFFDDSKVERVPFEDESILLKNSELFFERIMRIKLKDKAIYCDESIDIIDRFIKESLVKESENVRNYSVILIGAYLGQYVITKFNGNWVYDKAIPNYTLLDCFIRYTKDSDVYFKPFACTINRIFLGKKQSIKSEIDFIKKETKDDKK